MKSIMELFFAGMESSATVLLWVIAWLLHFPDVRVKLLEEIEDAIGTEAAPSNLALDKFHYLRAFLDEVLRKSSVADLNMLHNSTRPVGRLAGYDVPRGKPVVVNFWALHHDPKVWAEPMRFRPERFLDAGGKYRRDDNLVSFGAGTRRCVGEKLARMELFVLTVRLLQRVDFRLEKGCSLPSMEGRKKPLRCPEKY